ncbi:MAG TPA: adenylate/guanylate cyclase domain-containing protein, partial [Candidatus Cloacimonadota bacterium]|nr:adenylate/guanylate cyclase domain-containing protein [Candidatus Cloacimonadota bacterium]
MNLTDEIKDSGSHLYQLLEALYDGVYIVNPKRRILHWNKAAEEMTGFGMEEVLGKCCGDNILNHIDENGILLCRGRCPLQKSMDSGEKVSAKVYPRNKDGHRFPVETHITPLYDGEGALLGAIEVFRDISHQEDYRILQEKFNAMIKKYVSSTTFSDIQERLRGNPSLGKPRIIDLSVLYLDIVNFTTFSEHNSPEAVVEMLNDLFGVCDVITKESFGDIDKFIGDAVMAIFSDANDAARSAIKILELSLPEMNRIRRENQEEEIAVRIGINSGLVLQGDVGTLDRKDLTVIGDAVNIAARIEKSSLPNRLMISEATLSRLDPELRERFVFHHSETLKGKTEEIKIYIH